jgi:hypothetical protein
MTWRPGGSEPAQLFALPVDDPEINVGKPHQPVTGFGFGKPTGSPISASLRKIISPPQRISPLLRTPVRARGRLLRTA